ncbi:MAG TPA: hypothetical protein VGK09_10680 [Rhodocyclaceae bacterium]|jgi:hypothetical protein
MSIAAYRNRLSRITAKRNQAESSTPGKVSFYDPANPPASFSTEPPLDGPMAIWLPYNGREISTKGGV